ncbi:MAG: TetR/AcrR family transcriptional regulator [Pseudomonadota bacterium]|nr:TetR/AcrR family transcriptional regulator [Pseudomonadota bacterium]
MTTQARRQREYEQRETLLLDSARRIIRREGVSALTMDKLAAATEYAKGTIYKHFSCKEDILCGLCLDSLRHLHATFQQLSQFAGNTRSRMICLGIGYQLYTQRFPEEFDLLVAARSNNIREKASPQRLQQIDAADELVLNRIRELIVQAQEAGELTLPPRATVDDLCLGLWSVSFGLLALEHARDMIPGLDLTPPQPLLLQQISCLLDGYRWHPLSTETDYSAIYTAVYQHLQQLMSRE